MIRKASSGPAAPVREWAPFPDPANPDRRWMADITWLASPWRCLFGCGCPGVLTAPAPELEQGCCSYGAHFTGKKDRKRVEALIAELGDDEWQFRSEAAAAGGAIHKNEDDEVVTRVVDGACIMLNRPGFPAGA